MIAAVGFLGALMLSDVHSVSAQAVTPASLWNAWNGEFTVLFPLEISIFCVHLGSA